MGKCGAGHSRVGSVTEHGFPPIILMGGDEEPGPGVGAGDGLAIRERDRRLKQKAVTQGQIKVGTTGDTQVTQKRKDY